MFLKIQLSVFAKTNVTLDGTYELTRRSTMLFSPAEVLHETLLLLAIHWFQWEKLTLVYLFWMQIARAVRATDSCFTFYLWSSVSNVPEAIAMRNNCTVKSASPKRQVSCRSQTCGNGLQLLFSFKICRKTLPVTVKRKLNLTDLLLFSFFCLFAKSCSQREVLSTLWIRPESWISFWASRWGTMACHDLLMAPLSHCCCICKTSCEALHESALKQFMGKCNPFMEINILVKRKMENSSVV